jgi:CheY-like chemotaxis protein
MPVMDGFEATRIIRDQTSSVQNHAVPIIAMTAFAMKGDEARCLAEGMNDYIAKPVDAEVLVTKVDYWASADGFARGEIERP